MIFPGFSGSGRETKGKKKKEASWLISVCTNSTIHSHTPKIGSGLIFCALVRGVCAGSSHMCLCRLQQLFYLHISVSLHSPNKACSVKWTREHGWINHTIIQISSATSNTGEISMWLLFRCEGVCEHHTFNSTNSPNAERSAVNSNCFRGKL